MSALALTELERAILERVEQQGGRATWHSIAILLGPVDESPVVVLRRLAQRRLIADAVEPGRMTRHAVLPLGLAALHGRDRVAAAALLAEAIAAGPLTLLELFPDVLAEPARFAAALVHLLAELPEQGRAVALGLGYLPADAAERIPLALRLVDDPALLLEVWAPPRLQFLGALAAPLPQPHWDALLARGLAHPSPITRGHAAISIYATDRGAGFVGELLALVPSVGMVAILALAGASDDASLAALLQLLDGPDAGHAATAARALAERPDGDAGFRRALTDPRAEVRNAAGFASSIRERSAEARARRRGA